MLRRAGTFAQLEAGDVKVTDSNMGSSRQAAVIQVVKDAFNKSSNAQDAAEYILNTCGRKFGGSWDAVVGSEFKSYVWFKNNNYLKLQIADTKVIVFQADT